ncbi:MAG: hypothetical protein IMF11_00805, partial [Proteobacteria bacterium]|nr:hypothetical protein [Pseudomonadota bacterium]
VLLLWGLTAAPCLAATDSAQADFIPWSGYWWPTAGGGLANGYGGWGHPAPLEKYELLVNGAYPGQITNWELENNYDPDAPSWYGQCHAWAAAAATENITFFPSSYENIIFRVGDKKGLLTACHGSDPSVRATGYDGPHVFHEWLLLYIKENKKSFVADLGVPGEAWFYPVYKYELNTVQNGNMISVRCQIWYADDRVDPDFQGTQVKTTSYTYDLFVNGEEITGGEWTGTSEYLHPKTLFFPLSPESTNPYISDIDYQTIKDIALHTDDFLENDSPVRLLPGNYNLILLNEDIYYIQCQIGETIWFDFTKLDDIREGIRIRIEDAGEITVLDDILEGDMSFSILAENPPYTLLLSREDYGGGGIYSVRLDLKKDNKFLCPKIQKGSGWNGFAVTNTTEIPLTDVQVVAYNEANEPVATIMGPLTLDSGEKLSFCLSNLPIRVHELPFVFTIKIMAGQAFSALYLGGLWEENMLGFARSSKGRRLVLPDTSSMFNPGKYVSWGIYNGDTFPVTADLSLYSMEGTLQKETTLDLTGNSLNRYTPTNNPFNRDMDNGWIMIEVYDDVRLEGYVLWTKNGSGGAESMFALNSLGTRFFVPHVAQTDLWSTELNLINVSDIENEVSLNLVDGEEAHHVTLELFPFEKRCVDVAELFTDLGPETLDRSALIITTQRDITGYFSYETGSSSAYYPLTAYDEIRSGLLIPHVASDHYWWTGVAIFNPIDEEVEVSIIPYNIEGEVITEGIKRFALETHKKKTFTFRTLFGLSLACDISWVKIQASDHGISGLFLYGDIDVNLISGSDLYRVETD